MTLEVCLSPSLYPYRHTNGPQICVVIDILRFTTSLVSAFDEGVKEVIPVSTPGEAESMKQNGFLVAAEREGLKLPFADFGNSARDFRTPAVKGKTIVYSTTNGTVAMNMAAADGPVVAAAFTNSAAVAAWLTEQKQNVVILCSGWKNLLSTEDSLCAGFLAEKVLVSQAFTPIGDEAHIAIKLWHSAKNKLKENLMQTSHYQRLLRLGVDPLPEYTIQTGISGAVPVFKNGRIADVAIKP